MKGFVTKTKLQSGRSNFALKVKTTKLKEKLYID